MAFSLYEFFSGAVGSTVGEFLVLRRRKRQSAGSTERYANGETVRISGCVYGLNPLASTVWTGGEIEVVPGQIVWHAGRFRSGRGRTISADSFLAIQLRQVTTRESWAVTSGCISLVGELDGRRMELAVLEDDIVLVLDALKATRLLD